MLGNQGLAGRRLAFRALTIWFGLAMLAVGPPAHATADPASTQYVRTQSGRVRCLIMANYQLQGVQSGGPAVACEGDFLQAPARGYGAVVSATGAFHWVDGNIGGVAPDFSQTDTTLTYGQSYKILGWTILPSSDGTRFTNNGTGHGMFVSVENVYAF